MTTTERFEPVNFGQASPQSVHMCSYRESTICRVGPYVQKLIQSLCKTYLSNNLMQTCLRLCMNLCSRRNLHERTLDHYLRQNRATRLEADKLSLPGSVQNTSNDFRAADGVLTCGFVSGFPLQFTKSLFAQARYEAVLCYCYEM